MVADMMRTRSCSNLLTLGVLATSLVAVGCGRSDEADAGPAPAASSASATGPEATVTGCLTASLDGRSYALSPADSSALPAGQPIPGGTTISYELVGNLEDFRRHANQEVTARGRTELSATREAEVARTDEATQAPAPGVGDTPTVETKEEVQVEVRRLHVDSVVATGTPCRSLGPTDGRATGPATEAAAEDSSR